MLNQHNWFEPFLSEATKVCICGAMLGKFYDDILYKANEKECVIFYNHINKIPSCPLSDDEKKIKIIIE